RETIAAFSEAFYVGVLTGEITEKTVATYLRGHINAVRVCTNALAEGCWTHTAALPSYPNSTGFVLHNGATIAGMDDAGSVGYDAFLIDWNGPKGSNIEGDDQLVVKLIISDSQGRPGTLTSYETRALSKE